MQLCPSFLTTINIGFFSKSSVRTEQISTSDRASYLLVVTFSRRGHGDTLTTASTASVQYLATTLGGHSLSEAVCRLATLLTWLICAFHSVYYLPVYYQF